MRNVIGYVAGQGGHFGRVPFYSVRLPLDTCRALEELLARAGAEQRHTTTLSISYHQPDRLRLTEIEAPEYELRAAPQYVRGDVIRIQGREGVSVGLDISARFGVPLVRQQLSQAMARAREYVEFRVPSRSRSVIEFLPDVDLTVPEQQALVAGSMSAAAGLLPLEDFSDWEK